MNTPEYRNYRRMTKMTVRFLEKDTTVYASPNAAVKRPTTPRATTPTTSTAQAESVVAATTRISPPAALQKSRVLDNVEKGEPAAKQTSLTTSAKSVTTENTKSLDAADATQTTQKTPAAVGRYTNWNSQHGTLAAQPWCCIGDLMAFCDKYEYRSLNRNDPQTHSRIVAEVKSLLTGAAPFDIRKRFPSDIHSPENLWVCIGRCAAVEYHLNRIQNVFRRPLDKLSADKQRMVRHDFHLAVNELRLDISARISEVRLYDRHVFEREFRLEWQDEPMTN